METVDDRTFGRKVKDFIGKGRDKVIDGWHATCRFVGENKREIGFTMLVLGPGLLKMGDTIIRTRKLDKVKKQDECDYYDPRTGEHWYTRKPLTNNQKLNLEQRYNNGESKGEILRSMHML